MLAPLAAFKINVPELVVPESAEKLETLFAVAFAVAEVTLTTSPVSRSVIVSFPDPTLNVSFPEPPVN